ncbi:hypothetical protein HDA32_003367 [Spinactinospora alkalitolerans]|uniref:DUF1360 domain-containing protein n=1 Tax=Spinactinospora alkalitolerans TaxID=687207 RepID=A0A852TY92_9ACTN|nr:DUF1360 domain-containing protein [Spinactinospora alkalitolerans]NYE48247.1 hypothetical protein [Spinactinospora alkalitolerans]
MAKIEEAARAEERAYENGESRPTGAYLGTMLAYAAGVGVIAAASRIQGRRTPPSVSPWDLLLISVSTHKASRLLAKDPVTSPLRVPFTRFKGVSGPSELQEEVRGSGARHAIGELLTCPFCVAQWVATGHVAGLILSPRLTRLAAATMTAVGAADWMQLGYAWLQQRTEGGSQQ